MGLRDRLGLVRDVAAYSAQSLSLETAYSLPSSGDRDQVKNLPVAVAQAFGINMETDRVTREEAMSVPAVSQGRQIICDTLGSQALFASDANGRRLSRPLLDSPSPAKTASWLITWTLDDMLFNGVAWWRVLSRDGQGYPLTVERLTSDRVTVDGATGRVRVDGKLVANSDVIQFLRNSEGLLAGKNARSIRTALLLEDAVRRFGRMDIPLGFLKDVDGSMTESEITELLDSWERARKQRTTGYLPEGLEYHSAEFDAAKIGLGEARSFQQADIARMMNLPASAINAPTNSSMTYSNIGSERRQLVDLTLKPLMTPFEQRLSMPDVTPPGVTVRMDLTRFLLGDTAQIISSGAAAIAAGLMTANEVRTDWLGLSPLPTPAALGGNS